jgi:hypothetical protein
MTEIRDYNNKLIQINFKDNKLILKINKEIIMFDVKTFKEFDTAINLELEIGLKNNDN